MLFELKHLFKIFIILTISCDTFAQKDSSIYCRQYIQAIDYIRQDTFVKSVYKINECKFHISDELISGGIDPTFFEEFIFYLFKKHVDSVDRKLIDSTYGKIAKKRDTNIYKIKCLHSDTKFNLLLQFARENDSIFGVVVLKKERRTLVKKQSRKNKKNGTMTISGGINYLFIFDKENKIKAILKKEFEFCYP